MKPQDLNTAHRLMLNLAELKQEKATLNSIRDEIPPEAPFAEVQQRIDDKIRSNIQELIRLGK